MTRVWEYLAVDCADVQELNALGADGWELIGRMPTMPAYEDEQGEVEESAVLLFKREREP